MFKIKKKDLLYGYIAYFFKYSSNILVLPFVLINLTSPEYAIWNVFLAISTFVILFDLGYGVVVKRYIMFAYSGAESIDSEIIPKIKVTGQPNFKLLYQIMIASSRIYKKISKLSIIVLTLLTPYIIYISVSEYTVLQIVFPWAIFSTSVAINMYILSDATVIKGLGLIGELQKITLINSIVSTVLKMVLLELGLGVLGLSISFFATSLMLAYQYKKITNTVKNKNIGLFRAAMKSFNDDFKESFKIIKSKSKGMGKVIISNFLQNQIFIIIAPLFITLEIMGRYGLTWQIIGIVASLSSITFMTFTMQMGNYLVTDKKKKLRETFAITMLIFMVLYICGALVTMFFGRDILQIIGSNIDLLSNFQLFLVILYVFVIQMNQKSINILSLSNNQNFVKALIVSSALIVTINVVLLLFGFGITAVLINGIIIQSSYNLWKWLLESMKLCSVKFTDFYILPYLKIKKYLVKSR